MIQDPLTVADQPDELEIKPASRSISIALFTFKVLFTVATACIVAASYFFQHWGFGTPSTQFYVGLFMIYAGMVAVWLYSKSKPLSILGYCLVLIGLYLTFVM